MSVQRRPKTGRPKTGRVRWVCRYYDPAGDEHQKSFATKKEAQAHEQEQLRLMRRAEWVDAENSPLLRDIWPAWEAAAETEGTRAVRALVGKNLGALADTRIAKIRPAQLRAWQTDLRDGRPWVDGCTGLSLNTRVTWWAQLSGCLRMAVLDEQLIVNPCSRVGGPGAGVEPVDPRTLPTEEQIRDAVIWADTHDRDTLATMMLLAVATGMRPGEVCGLRWRNVDRDARTIHVVEQTAQRPAPGSDGWTTLKTRNSRRVVPVPPEIMSRLLRHRLLHPAAPDDALFRTPTGLLWTSDLLEKAVKVANRRGGWTAHALRHVFATTMLASGRSIKAVQKTLGHASAATTIDVYWHVLPDEELLLRDTSSDLVRAICGQTVPGVGTRKVGVPAQKTL